ncbi:MAG TPA: TRAP transporter small permease [Gammaproteobacteria bacterium]|jgi:TRAP-type C4-dicarboxylate transport system permease small subunit
MTNSGSLPARLIRLLHAVEDGILILLLTAMLLLGVTQILLRNVFDSGLLWAGPLLRVMLLWVGLLGAMVASRYDKHIGIDVLSRLAGEKWRPWLRIATDLFAGLVCVIVAFYAGRFVLDEFTYATPGFAGIPAWMLEIVIPLAFGVIALRYLISSGMQLQRGLKGSIRV